MISQIASKYLHKFYNNDETNSKYDQALVKKAFAIYGLHQHNNRPSVFVGFSNGFNLSA